MQAGQQPAKRVSQGRRWRSLMRELLETQSSRPTLPAGVRPLELFEHLRASLAALEQGQTEPFSTGELLRLCSVLVLLVYRHALSAQHMSTMVPWSRLMHCICRVLDRADQQVDGLECALALGGRAGERVAADFWASACRENDAEFITRTVALLSSSQRAVLHPALQLVEACSYGHVKVLLTHISQVVAVTEHLVDAVQVAGSSDTTTALRLLRNILQHKPTVAVVHNDKALLRRMASLLLPHLQLALRTLVDQPSPGEGVDLARLTCHIVYLVSKSRPYSANDALQAASLLPVLQQVFAAAVVQYQTCVAMSPPSPGDVQYRIGDFVVQSARSVHALCSQPAFLLDTTLHPYQLPLLQAVMRLIDAMLEQTPGETDDDEAAEHFAAHQLVLAGHNDATACLLVTDLMELAITLLKCTAKALSEALAAGLPKQLVSVLLWLFRKPGGASLYTIQDFDATVKCLKLLRALTLYPDGVAQTLDVSRREVGQLCDRLIAGGCFTVRSHRLPAAELDEHTHAVDVILVKRSEESPPREEKAALQRCCLWLVGTLYCFASMRLGGKVCFSDPVLSRGQNAQSSTAFAQLLSPLVDSTRRVLEHAKEGEFAHIRHLTELCDAWSTLCTHAIIRNRLREDLNFAPVMISAYIELFTRCATEQAHERASHGRKRWLRAFRGFQFDRTFLSSLCRYAPARRSGQPIGRAHHASIIPFVLEELNSTIASRVDEALQVLRALVESTEFAAHMAQHGGLDQILRFIHSPQQRPICVHILERFCSHAAHSGVGRALTDITTGLVRFLLSAPYMTFGTRAVLAEVHSALVRHPLLVDKCADEYLFLVRQTAADSHIVFDLATATAVLGRLTTQRLAASQSALALILPFASSYDPGKHQAERDFGWLSLLCLQYLSYCAMLPKHLQQLPAVDALWDLHFPSQHDLSHQTVIFAVAPDQEQPVVCCRDCLIACSDPMRALLAGSFAESRQSVVQLLDVLPGTLQDLNDIITSDRPLCDIFLGVGSQAAAQEAISPAVVQECASRVLHVISFGQQYLAETVVERLSAFASLLIRSYRQPLAQTLPPAHFPLSSHVSQLLVNWSPMVDCDDAGSSAPAQPSWNGPSTPEPPGIPSWASRRRFDDHSAANLFSLTLMSLLGDEQFAHLIASDDDCSETSGEALHGVLNAAAQSLAPQLGALVALPGFGDRWEQASPLLMQYIESLLAQ
ncbi:hypothetical protein RI367_007644 [Sorochytrium milnesiophthora]